MNSATFIIDFDSTIVCCEALEELAQLALDAKKDFDEVMHRLREINTQGMSGQLPFDKSLQQRLKLFAANRKHIAVLTTQLYSEITPSIARHRVWFERNAERIYIISGGFDDYIVPVVSDLGIAADHVFANAFRFNSRDEIVGYDDTRPLSKASGKVRQLAILQLPHPIIVIGDGYTDYEIRAAGEADAFWAFCENVTRPSVIAHADRVFNNFDEVIEYIEIM